MGSSTRSSQDNTDVHDELTPACTQLKTARMISLLQTTPPTVDNFFLQFDDSFPPFFTSAEKEHTTHINIFAQSLSLLLCYNSLLCHLPFLYLSLNMPGPDPRRTKPSAYTIPKAGSSKSVSHRPPLHAATGAAATKDDNPRPLTHQEVRRGKAQKPPTITRTSARLSGTRRSPRPASRSRVANLKRPEKYDPKSASNLTQLGSKPPRLAACATPPSASESPGPAVVLSDSEDDVLLLNDFDGEDNDESIEAIQEAIDQMGVNQPDSEFEMAVQAGSEYAYLLAGSAEEKKRAEALINKVHNETSYL